MIFSRVYHHCGGGGGGRCNDLIGVVVIIYFSLEYTRCSMQSRRRMPCKISPSLARRS